MGEGDKRQSRGVVRFDARELARLTRQPIPPVDGELEASEHASKDASKDAAAALVSRTATRDDPMTTMLLAEASRRRMTADVPPGAVPVARADDDPSED